VNSRFAEADLGSIVTHHARSQGSGLRHQATETRSLTQGTSAWAALQRPGEHAPAGRTEPGTAPEVGPDKAARTEVTE